MSDFLVLILLFGAVTYAAKPPITITGPEQKEFVPSLPDGGLPWCPGVHSIQVFRASRAALTDGKGWTYNHHVDLAIWKGRMYLAWNSCEKDEDVWPSRELYATSTDGIQWSDSQELFPMGVSAALRMYFFHAGNGRMLAIGTYRAEKDHAPVGGAMVVREIRADHLLGPVFTLQAPTDSSLTNLAANALYDTCSDNGFVDACEQLLGNKPFLEQSDYGDMLRDRRMKWHDINNWPADEPSRQYFPNRFGKAMSFYHRKDGALVAMMKFGWVLVSHDEGATWSSPVRPPTLVAGMAKVWGQRTSDGRYALAYNPDLNQRYPLVVVTGDDGISFGQMRVIFGDLPPMRYPGVYKVPGPQYVRGVSEWATDRTWKDPASWIAFSVNKEDIWISRVPVTAGPQASASPWNTYSPRWAPVTIENETLTLDDRDPMDFARATRVMEPATQVEVAFDLTIEKVGDSPLFLDLLGPRRANGARVVIDPDRQADGKPMHVTLKVDCQSKVAEANLNEQALKVEIADIPAIHSVSLQTGERRASIDLTDDRPINPARYRVQHFKLSSVQPAKR